MMPVVQIISVLYQMEKWSGELAGQRERERERQKPGNTKGGRIIVPLTSCLTGLESAL